MGVALLGAALVVVGFAGTVAAAGGSAGHSDAGAAHHHVTAGADTDCPAHHDGHRLSDLDCQLACASLLPATPGDVAAVALQRASIGGPASRHDVPYGSHTPHIPTPPPNLV